jgi:threonine dehydrogenase-like Zn-dependent dehydrogenase
MKILQITAPGKSEILDVPIPEPGANQVLLRVQAVTTCSQWDLHLRHNQPMFPGHDFTYPYAPGQPGHEATGEIVAAGENVKSVQVGERVSAWRDQDHELFGCFAQYALREAENVVRVPSHLPLAATAPLELAMCVGASFLMLRNMDAIRGRRFGVTGLGPAGLIAAQMAKAEGAAGVIGFDLSAARREFAMQKFGGDILQNVFDPATESEPFPVRPQPTNLDCAMDCVGARRSVEWLMDRTAETVALFGVQREDYTFAPRHYLNLRLCGYPGHGRAAAEYAVELMEKELLDLSLLSTHFLPLESYEKGIDLLEKQQAVKVCFLPWQGEGEKSDSN